MNRLVALLGAVFSVGMLAGAAPALAAPVRDLEGHHGPTTFQAGRTGEYSFTLNNIGDAPGGPVTVR